MGTGTALEGWGAGGVAGPGMQPLLPQLTSPVQSLLPCPLPGSPSSLRASSAARGKKISLHEKRQNNDLKALPGPRFSA